MEKSKLHKYANQNLLHSRIHNFSKWGQDAKHNILYITGISGSGKSTVAKDLADENTSIIHLDSYFEAKNLIYVRNNQNTLFNDFLLKNKFNNLSLNNKTLFDTNPNLYFRKVDIFSILSEKFGESEYNNGRKVIMEGQQLIDDTLYPNKEFFDNKPIITLTTKSSISSKRASRRDSSQ